jgi:hypothetical protein
MGLFNIIFFKALNAFFSKKKFMKIKYLLPFVCLIVALNASAQFEGTKQVFSSPKLKEAIAKHKTVAILPFAATITYKKVPKDYNAQANKADEQKLALNMQQDMYTCLLRKAKDFSVTFQDLEKTNVLLKQKGVYDKIGEFTQDSIYKILGVDAVIKCNYAYERTGSEAGAIAKTILFGAGTGKTGTGSLVMQIYNGEDGELLWRFFKEMNEDILGSANQVMERMMRKVARNFPYEK